MSLAEFVKKEGQGLKVPGSMLQWAEDPKAKSYPQSNWKLWRDAHMTSAGKSEDQVCDMNTYRAADKMVFTDPQGGGRIFGCGNWPNVGEPRFHVSRNGKYAGRWDAPPSSFALLRNHFMWHPDVFDIAGRVVEHLGLFSYVSVHARYGDFQFQNHRRVQDTLLKDGWLSMHSDGSALLQTQPSSENAIPVNDAWSALPFCSKPRAAG